jgi:programmed cell death protein 5
MSVSNDDELTHIREQRKLQLQKQFESQVSAQADADVAAHQKQLESTALDGAMRSLLTPDARSRLATISLATPERSESIKRSIIQLYESKSFSAPMTDEQLKSLLMSQSKSRHSASIRRI